MTEWTHWFEPHIIGGYAERCIILETSTSWWRVFFMFDVKIKSIEGYTMWVSSREVFENTTRKSI